MNLSAVTRKFRTDEECLEHLEKTRWPDGVRCPTCGCNKVCKGTRKPTAKNLRTRFYQCLEPTCKAQFSATNGTIFHRSHIPLSTWFAYALRRAYRLGKVFGVVRTSFCDCGGVAISLPRILTNFAGSWTTIGFMHLLYDAGQWVLRIWALVFVCVVALVFASIPVAAAAKVWLWVRELMRRAKGR